ncbi:MFS transporter [Amycolatopsis rifamycinica]|uniref:Major facilitator transporter n=1 Tax=Amycolatopsis rifamycinica TaxID=287986 RepID=A0A066UES6_9PSEU|nr:MFS transporter [Amycolatopsis rifamycinica]KDN22678.1 major facilitator transporter [Amycolatopsis rifamycinica]
MRRSSTGAGPHTSWNARLVGLIVVLALVNFVVDSAITAPLLVLPEMLDHFDTDQPAWLNATAMLAGVMWAPLLGKAADIHGTRKVLVLTLLLGGAGSLICAVAPHIALFVAGRMLQGASLAAVFLAVAIVRDACAPRIAMIAVGIVTSSSAVLNIASRFLIERLATAFGFHVLFFVSAFVAAAMAITVRTTIAESRTRTPGKLDLGGAVLLGGGLAGVLGYISLGSSLGWLAAPPLALLAVGVVALVWWFVGASRKPEPLIDVRNIGGPLKLTLLVIFLGAGAYQSMLQLIPLVGAVPAERGLGYGLAGQGSVALLLAVPAIGLVVGGPVAGWLAARIGPAATLAGGVVLGFVVSLGMLLGVAQLPVALCSAFLLGVTAGAIATSGFNTAAALAPTERQGVVSSLVVVGVSIGSVALDFVGSAVLSSTVVVVDGETMNSATGVFSYIAIASAAFAIAAVVAGGLVRRTRANRTPSAPGLERNPA